uniref:MRN complex-interacting protein N-terminal domain-containing protein n=1 Tax=Gasterosteus aculeatus aculeatus TaxID=481459 RepID=A0AAQ4R2B3_GASAC
MVQEFHVLRCYSCESFQVQQVKKVNKWICKLCGEKQSQLKEFGRGSGAECRRHVQKLNAMRGAMMEEHNSCSLRFSQWGTGSVDEPDCRREATVCVAGGLSPDGPQPPARWKGHKQVLSGVRRVGYHLFSFRVLEAPSSHLRSWVMMEPRKRKESTIVTGESHRVMGEGGALFRRKSTTISTVFRALSSRLFWLHQDTRWSDSTCRRTRLHQRSVQ